MGTLISFRCIRRQYDVHRVSSSRVSPVGPSFRALSASSVRTEVINPIQVHVARGARGERGCGERAALKGIDASRASLCRPDPTGKGLVCASHMPGWR